MSHVDVVYECGSTDVYLPHGVRTPTAHDDVINLYGRMYVGSFTKEEVFVCV